MKCQYCCEEFTNYGIKQHEKNCLKTIHLKEEIIKSYLDDKLSIRELSLKYKLCIDKICKYLKGYTRNQSESNKLMHELHPEKFKHTQETKDKLSKIRIEHMKEHPLKCHWLKKDMSYPEKQFYNKLIELKYDKKYHIVRELAFVPYFIDFAFINEKLAVEIDGSQHLEDKNKERDNKKDKLLLESGWSVIRFTAKEVNENINNVVKVLNDKLYNLECVEIIKVGIERYKSKSQKKDRDENGYTLCQLENRKIKDRPSLEQLIKDVNELGYSKTSIKYNVNRTSIKRWLKQYLKKDNINSIINENSLTIKQHKAQLNKIKKEDRPSFEILFNEVYISGYTITGNKYNVIDTTIKKWLVHYKNNNDMYKDIDLTFNRDKNNYTEKQKLYHLNSRKVKNRPSLGELENLLKEFNYTEVGKIYNVVGKTIKKWLDNYLQD